MRNVFHFTLSFFIEFGGLVGFLIFATYYNFFIGIYVIMFLTILSLIIAYLRDKRVPIFSIYTAGAVLFFGFWSVYLHNEYIMVLEYTIYNFAFAIVAYIGYYLDKPLMKTLFSTMFCITDRGWHIMSLRWAQFFVVSGFLNEFFWRFTNEQIWLQFRTVLLGVSTAFGIYMFTLARKERLPEATKWGMVKY